MSDWTELKRLAEDTKGWQELRDFWPVEEEDCDPSEFSWEIGAINEGEKYEVITVNTWQYDEPYSSEKLARYYAAANPKTILALIAENEKYKAQFDECARLFVDATEQACKAQRERDKLQEKVAALRMLLSDAADEIGEWGAYASGYFQDKHDLAGCVAKFKDAARVTPVIPKQKEAR